MQFNKLKALVLATSAIAGLSFAAPSANAANPETMGVSVEAIAAITVTKLNDMNFGKWLFAHDGTEDILLRLNPTNNAVAVTQDDGTTALATSTAQQIAGTSRSGRLNVLIPSGLNNYVLDMTVAAPTAFTTPAEYVLSRVTYVTATETTPTVITTDGTTIYPVTVLTGGTAETVYFGADVEVDSQPTVGVDNGATFAVTFAY